MMHRATTFRITGMRRGRLPSFCFQESPPSQPLAAWGSNNCNEFLAKEAKRPLSTWSGRGHDMLGESFLGGNRPKVLLEAMAPSGFDVSNLLKKIDPNEDAPHGALHMMGSIVAFPSACFLWNIEEPSEITMEALAPVLLHRPKIEFLFLGTAKPMNQDQLNELKTRMKEKTGVVVEWLPLSEAMATFNILNGEDRMVATALVLDKDESNYVSDDRD